jgi:hypothetical protein
VATRRIPEISNLKCEILFPKIFSTPTANQTHPTLRKDGEEWGARKGWGESEEGSSGMIRAGMP